MALKGTLKDFSIADIFQLIAQQQKSGSLYITNADQVCQIMFDKGQVVIARFKQSNEDLMLGNMLLKAMVVSEDQLQEAIENQQSTLRSIGDILLTLNYITTDILKEFVTLQLKEVLFRIFQWKEGLYEFLTEDFKYNKKILGTHRAEQLLLDGFRMLDEWPALIKKISTLSTIYKPIVDISKVTHGKKPGKVPFGDEKSIDEEIDDAFQEFGGSSKESDLKPPPDMEFSSEEKKVIGHLDGWKTIREVIELSRLGTFETCSALVALLDKGAIIKVEVSTPSKNELELAFKPVSMTRQKFFARFITELVLIAALLFILPSLIFYRSSNIMTSGFIGPDQFRSLGSDPVKKYLDINKLDMIRFSLELYRFNMENYPENLKALAGENLVSDKMTNREFFFTKTGNTYILLP